MSTPNVAEGKRRMAGYRPLQVTNEHAPVPKKIAEPVAQAPVEAEPAPVEVAPAPSAGQVSVIAVEPEPLPAGKRRMAGYQPRRFALAGAVSAQPATPSATPISAPAAESGLDATPSSAAPTNIALQSPAGSASGRVVEIESQPLSEGKRRMAGYSPLRMAYQTAAVPQGQPDQQGATAAQTAPSRTPGGATQPAVAPASGAVAATTGQVVELPSPSLAEGKRRMAGYEPLRYSYQPAEVAQPAEQINDVHSDTDTPATAEPAAMASATQTVTAPGAQASQPPHSAVSTPSASPTQPQKSPQAQKTQPRQTKERSESASRWGKRLIALGSILLFAAVVILAARWLRTLEPVQEFIATYDGHSTIPDWAPVGFDPWVGWAHFFNFFLMALIIKTGMQIRHEQRPEGYWTAKKGGMFSPFKNQSPPKVSINQFTHQALDVLWVVNGIIYIVLLFISGRWARIVPMDWDIFPNMLSAGIQYASLNWPDEHGWVHYNALQVMAYFSVVFIAAPLAIISGARMSTWWPKNAKKLNELYKIEYARKIHFPVMIFFTIFLVTHVFLVFTTGALANLNHMFTSRDEADFWGLIVFLVALAITVVVSWLLRPMVVQPVAEKTGQVTAR